jgi:hypothetical protein
MVLSFITAAISRLATETCEAKSHLLTRKAQLPKRYRLKSFYWITLGQTLLAGILGALLSSGSLIGAAAIGAALPTLFKSPATLAKFLKSVL